MANAGAQAASRKTVNGESRRRILTKTSSIRLRTDRGFSVHKQACALLFIKKQGFFGEDSGEDRGGRAAAGAGADLAEAGRSAGGSGRVGLRWQHRQTDPKGGERMSCGCRSGCVSGEIGAGNGSGKSRSRAGCGIGHHGAHARGHGAVMCSVAATARRQARIVVASWKGCRKRPEPEEQNQE